jgi:hypothetical protein
VLPEYQNTIFKIYTRKGNQFQRQQLGHSQPGDMNLEKQTKTKQTNSVALSPRANYTD